MLDPSFLSRLEKLALRSRARAAGARQGGHTSRRRGQSLEFADHREYVPGDDIRHLDWHLYARLDTLFVKLFEAREDRTVQIVLDRSASMAGSKWEAARKAAAAVAWASLCSLDRVQLFVADPALTSDPTRELHFNWIGQVSLDKLTLEWMIPYERDARQVSGGGSLLNNDYRQEGEGFAFNTETIADDKVSLVALQYKERFRKDAFGLSLKGYFVKWTLDENPLGAFPPSSLSERTQVGFFTRLKDQGQFRYGLNLDMDVYLPFNNRLIFGGRCFKTGSMAC